MPLNRRYPIAEVLDAAAEFAGAKGRRVTFEYACIAGVNDSPRAGRGARPAARRVPGRGRRPREPDPRSTPPPGSRARARTAVASRAFADRLRAPRGRRATVRRNRGTDIDAACGQLRSREAMPSGRRPDRPQWRA